MDGDDFVIRALLDFPWDFSGKLQIENLLALLVTEANDHGHRLLKIAYDAIKIVIKSVCLPAHRTHHPLRCLEYHCHNKTPHVCLVETLRREMDGRLGRTLRGKPEFSH